MICHDDKKSLKSRPVRNEGSVVLVTVPLLKRQRAFGPLCNVNKVSGYGWNSVNNELHLGPLIIVSLYTKVSRGLRNELHVRLFFGFFDQQRLDNGQKFWKSGSPVVNKLVCS